MPAVILLPHDPSWAGLYAAEEAWLRREWAAAIAEVHHVGSTAIAGISAKPIVDILVLLTRPRLTEAEVQAAVDRGYEYRGEQGIAGREYFSRRSDPVCHIHAFERGHPEASHMLRFRDHLRANEAARLEYEALKQDLARRFPDDRVAYTNGKEAFVRRIVE
jgi:GrpB-like predicted nucleotidyltransferase (UPF0157 family)